MGLDLDFYLVAVVVVVDTVTVDGYLIGAISSGATGLRGVVHFQGIALRHPAALNLMIRKCSINTFPKICIPNGLYRAEMLPGVIVFSPFAQTVLQSSRNIATGSDEGHAAGLLERFETSQNREQCRSFRLTGELAVGGFGLFAGTDILQNEAPPATLSHRVGFTVGSKVAIAEKQVVWLWGGHDRLIDPGVVLSHTTVRGKTRHAAVTPTKFVAILGDSSRYVIRAVYND